MIDDRVRMDAYYEALRRAVQPDSIVLDIGAGPGLMALLACRLGARRVYAVEPSDIVHVVQTVAARNGCGERVVTIQATSHAVELPEPADVIVSDLRGVLPLFRGHIAAVLDARNRLLKPGGVLIPRKDTLWGAVAEAPDTYAQLTGVWAAAPYGIDLSDVESLSTNDFVKHHAAADQLVTGARRVAVFDYTTVSSSAFDTTVEWRVERDATVHGLVLWFDTELFPDVGFSNAPGNARALYGNAFFPLRRPVTVNMGDVVAARVQACESIQGTTWRWETRIRGPDGERARFSQSTHAGTLLELSSLRRRGHSYVPRLNPDGDVALTALQLMDGSTALEAVARELSQRFPDRFPSWEAALSVAGELSSRYSK